MRQHAFNEFDLFTSSNISDLFEWFASDEIHGLMLPDALRLDLVSVVHYHPNDVSASLSYKPFIFLNSRILSNMPIHESVLEITSASQKISEILTEGFTKAKSKEVQKFGEDIAYEILHELNYPNVYHRI